MLLASRTGNRRERTMNFSIKDILWTAIWSFAGLTIIGRVTPGIGNAVTMGKFNFTSDDTPTQVF